MDKDCSNYMILNDKSECLSKTDNSFVEDIGMSDKEVDEITKFLRENKLSGCNYYIYPNSDYRNKKTYKYCRNPQFRMYSNKCRLSKSDDKSIKARSFHCSKELEKRQRMRN